MAISVLKTGLSIPFLLFALALSLPVLLACTSESSNLGQYKQGRTLHFSVVSVERTPELRYSTCDVLAGSAPPVCDPSGQERDWAITPSAEGMELVLVRARVENHTAVSAIVHVDRTGAELRDLSNGVYHPIAVIDSAWRDFRGEPEALVRMDSGECFDSRRSLLDVGAAVRWQNEAENAQYIDFEDSSWFRSPGRAEIAPGASLSGRDATLPRCLWRLRVHRFSRGTARGRPRGFVRLHRTYNQVLAGIL